LIEVEIKVGLSNSEEIKRKFIYEGGKYKISLHHEDTYFNMPRKLRDFRKTDEALRIRKSTEFHEDTPKETQTYYYLTYKGSKIDSSTKTRSELESKVADGEKIREILKILDFREVFTVKKERELYEISFLGKEIEVLFDYLPILDRNFMEVELRVESEDSKQKINENRKILFKFLEMLGIKKEESIKKSYLELIAERFKK
jgi:adenylate cyclase class 2